MPRLSISASGIVVARAGDREIMYSTRAEADLEVAFATAVQVRAAALVIGSPDQLFVSHAAQLGALALRWNPVASSVGHHAFVISTANKLGNQRGASGSPSPA